MSDRDEMEFDMLLENLRNLAHDTEHEGGTDGVEIWILEAVARLTAQAAQIVTLQSELDHERFANNLLATSADKQAAQIEALREQHTQQINDQIAAHNAERAALAPVPLVAERGEGG